MTLLKLFLELARLKTMRRLLQAANWLFARRSRAAARIMIAGAVAATAIAPWITAGDRDA